MSSPLIDRLIEIKRLPALALLIGRDPEILEKEALRLALAFARKEDQLLLRPEGVTATHPVEKVREFRESAHLRPLFGEVRLLLLLRADRMQPASANTLLKAIEEPLSFSRFIFTAVDRNALLPTIASRAEIYRIESPVPEEHVTPILETLFSEAPFSDYLRFSELIKELVVPIEKMKEKATSKEEEVQDPWQNEVFALFEEILKKEPRAQPFLKEARLRLERSFSLYTLFESLFLSLGYLR